MEHSLSLVTDSESIRRLLKLAPQPRRNSPKRLSSMSDNFANGSVLRPLRDTSAMMPRRSLFSLVLNKPRCLRTPTAQPKWLAGSMVSQPFTTTNRSLQRVSGPDEAWRGENITLACFAEQNGFSDPATKPTLMKTGYQRLTAFSRSEVTESGSQTSDAVTASPLSSW